HGTYPLTGDCCWLQRAAPLPKEVAALRWAAKIPAQRAPYSGLRAIVVRFANRRGAATRRQTLSWLRPERPSANNKYPTRRATQPAFQSALILQILRNSQ